MNSIDDLVENYTSAQLKLFADFHHISINQPLGRLVDAIAIANGKLQRAEMQAGEQHFRINNEYYTNEYHPLQPKSLADIEKSAKYPESLKEGTQLNKITTAGDIVSVPTREPFKIVAEFIKNNNLKLYGGTAVNKYIGKPDKFYKHSQLPDYDAYTNKPWYYGKKLADKLYEEGYQYVEAREGIHTGTIKVFVNFWPVADFTFIPTEMFEKIPTQKKDGFQVVAPEYLMISMYKELALPYDDPSRWRKVAYRQNLLKKWALPKFRIKRCGKYFDRPSNPELEDVLMTIDTFARTEKLLYYGPIAYNTYINIGSGQHDVAIDHLQLITNNLTNTTNSLLQILKQTYDGDFTVEQEYYIFKAFNQTSNYILWETGEKIYPIVLLTQENTCIPYKYLGKRYIVGIDYLKYELYFKLSISEEDVRKKLSCMIRYLDNVQQKYYKRNNITELNDSPFQRFITKCRGSYFNPIKVKLRERQDRRVTDREETIALKSDDDDLTLHGVRGRQIRIYPKSKVSAECKNLDSTNCFYPCAWKEEHQRCYDLPIPAYYPAIPELEKVVTDEYTVT